MNPIILMRKKKEISRSELSRKTRIPYQTLCQIEGGLVNTLQKKTLVKLSTFFETTPDTLAQEFTAWRQQT